MTVNESVDEMSVVDMSVDNMTLDKKLVGRMSVNETSLDEMSWLSFALFYLFGVPLWLIGECTY
jgi:hypothetical protein